MDFLFGIPFISATTKQVIDLYVNQVEKKERNGEETTVFFTPNPEQLTLSFHNSAFAQELTESTYNLPDGQGIVWALNRKKGNHFVRVPGRVIFHELMVLARARDWRVFLLGGKPGSAEAIAGTFVYDPGAVDISHETAEEEKRVLEKIQAYKPHILFVAYGAPWQERWILRHRAALTKAGVRVAMVVGGAFEYEAGMVPQVPSFVETIHLEWLWRLMTQPWRWKRQLRGLEFFIRSLFSL